MNETAIVPYNAPSSQEFNLQEELDKVITDAVQNNAPDDDEVAYLEHEKILNEKGHIDSESHAESDSSSSSEKSNDSGSGSENSADSGS